MLEAKNDVLFEPFTLGDLLLPNRVLMSPLTRSRSKQPGDIPWELNATYYAQRVGAGLIFAEATQVSPQGKGYAFTPGIYSTEQIDGWRLVTNAVQAISRDGRVEIGLRGDPDEVRITVADDGPGIPEAHLERIFEPFFTTKEEGEGTGLGLAVSRGIVEKLGGRIEVENRPDRGCIFRLVLPRRRS